MNVHGRRIRPRAGRRLILLAATLLVLGGATSAALAAALDHSAEGATSRVLPGTVSRLVSVSHEVGSVPSGERIAVTFPLKLSAQAALNTYVAGEYTPGSPDYRHFLSPTAFGARFGASSIELATAETALRALGFAVSTPSVNRLYVSAVGTAATIERAFATPLERFTAPAGAGEASALSGRSFFANTRDVTLPGSLSRLVTGVIGLDTSALPQPQLALPTRRTIAARSRVRAIRPALASPKGFDGGATPCASADAGGGYTAPDLAAGYDFNGLYAKGFHGEGMSAALVEFSDYHDSNVSAVESCYGITTPVTRREVDGGNGGAPGAAEAEDMADIGTILEMAPKLAHLYVYVAPISGLAGVQTQGDAEIDLYNAFVTDDLAPVLSSSWGDCEEEQSGGYDELFGDIAEEAAAQGQQIFDAAGDSGAVDCRGLPTPSSGSISVEQEAAVPWITGVGGTDLSVDSTVADPSTGQATVHREDTWNDGGAGGGGQSTVWAMPAWQSSYLAATHDTPQGLANDCNAPAGADCRMVPDIAMNGDPDAGGAANGGPTPPQFAADGDAGSPGYSIYCASANCTLAAEVGEPLPPVPVGVGSGAGGWYPIGGTSLATPLAASAAVLWDQEAKQAGLSGLGFLNPSLYRIASNSSDYAKDFHDITQDPSEPADANTNDDQYDTTDCPTGCNPNHLYAAGTGYDMASGLGSIDAANLGAALIADVDNVDLTPSTEQMYGYTGGGPSTTHPVSVTSGYAHSTYTATSSASWLHVTASGSVPDTLSWYADPTGLSAGSYTAHITVTDAKGGTATLTVDYLVTPPAKLSVASNQSPSSALSFSEQPVDSDGNATTFSCNDTTWGDELAPAIDTGDTQPTPASTLATLNISNSGPAGSVLHFAASYVTPTSSWLTTDLDPGSDPTGFQTGPSQPLVPTTGTLDSGESFGMKLASVADSNELGGYPDMNQGTYHGTVQVRDMADPADILNVPVTLVLGNGTGTPTIAASPATIAVSLGANASKTVDLSLSDASGTCGYAYSVGNLPTWASVNPYLAEGTVPVPAATAPPTSATDTGEGNGYLPITLSSRGLSAGTHHGSVTVNSQNAVTDPTTVPLTLTVTGPTSPGGGTTPPKTCTVSKRFTFYQRPRPPVRATAVVISVDGKVTHRYHGHRITRISFARPKAKQFTLTILTTLSDGEEIKRTQTYDGCQVGRAKVVVVHRARRRSTRSAPRSGAAS